jgi:hypothetical protein
MFLHMPIIFSTTINQGENRIMNHTLRNFTGAILAISALAVQDTRAGVAQPSGIANIVIPPNRTEFVGVPFARPVEFVGTINGKSTTSGNDTFTVTLDAGQSSLPNLGAGTNNTDAWYVLEILDGPAIGFLLPTTASTGNISITVQGSTGSISPVGCRFAIRKDWTLTTLFGNPSDTVTRARFGFGNSSGSPTIKAWIQTYDSLGAASTTYYLNETGTTTKTYSWRSASSPTVRNHARLSLGRGIVLVNRTASHFTVPVAGEYRVARTRLSVPGNKVTYLANPGTKDVTFSESTIPETSPTRMPGNSGSTDTYALWSSSNRVWTTYRIGGTSHSNGPSAYLNVSRINPTIPAFRALRVQPHGSNQTTITIAPAL